MNFKKKLANYIINFVLVLSMSFSFIYALTTSMNFRYPVVSIFAVISGLILIYSLIFYNKLTLKISGAAIAVILIGSVTYLFFIYGFKGLLSFIADYFNWLNNFIILQNISTNPLYDRILFAVICLLLTLFTFIFTIKNFKFVFILVFGIALFFLQWAFNFFVSYEPFYLFIFLILVYYMRHIYSLNSSKEINEYAYPAVFTIFVAPICAIILLVSFLIPSSPKPIEWKWLDTKINRAYGYFLNGGNISKFDYFSVASTGFGNNDGELGGKVKKDKTLVLKVDAPRPVYLKASIKDFYTGTSWKDTENDIFSFSVGDNQNSQNFDGFLKDISNTGFSYITSLNNNRPLIDYIEMLSGMSMLTNDTEFLSKYFFDDRIKVTYQNLQTKSLFFSNNLYNVSAPSAVLQAKPNGVILSKDRLKKNFSYSFDAYSLKTGDTKLEEVLRKSYHGFYNDYYSKLDELSTQMSVGLQEAINNPEFTYRIIGPDGYKSLIYKINTYGNIPENILNILANYNISVDDEIAKKYSAILDDGKTLYFVPLDTNIIDFSIKGKNITNLHLNSATLELLQSNSNEAYTKYLQLPETIPGRVRDLAVSITSSYQNQYDKAKAVEKYLSSDYKYTLSPKSTPKGRDFVDYFLFDSKQGYCTYYATSMVVLLRSIDIPARYVEGYALSSRPKKGVTYNVTNERAHAWVEVYFEGIGWIPFEPTAAFSGSFYENRKTVPFEPFSGNYEGNDPRHSGATGKDNNQPDTPTPPVKKNYTWLILLCVACILILAVLTTILINMLRRYLRIRMLKKSAPKESIVASYKYYLELLSLSGIGISPGETPFSYSERVDKFVVPKPTSFKSITDIFIIARYSQSTLGEKEKTYVNLYLTEIIEKIRSRLGGIRFFVYKFLLGKI